LKSFLSSEKFLTSREVTLFAGNLNAAYDVPPKATNRASKDTTTAATVYDFQHLELPKSMN
jgi:hypothetical protein